MQAAWPAPTSRAPALRAKPAVPSVTKAGTRVQDEEFDAFYHESFGRIVGTLYAMIGDVEEAQDAVQEAFIRAWDRRGQLEASRSSGLGPEAWVRTVAYRLAVSRWRRTRRGLLAHRKHGVPSEVPEPQIHHVALVAALRQLPEAQRRSIVLHHLADMSVEQVAAETQQPVGTVKAQLSRGRLALRGLLEDAGAESTTQPGTAAGLSSATSTHTPRTAAPVPATQPSSTHWLGNDHNTSGGEQRG